jgi:hypothetical protein
VWAAEIALANAPATRSQHRVQAPLLEGWMRGAGSLQELLARDTLLGKMRYSS